MNYEATKTKWYYHNTTLQQTQFEKDFSKLDPSNKKTLNKLNTHLKEDLMTHFGLNKAKKKKLTKDGCKLVIKYPSSSVFAFTLLV